MDTRQAVKQTYDTGGGQPYDQVRWEDPRGRLLSQHDLMLFHQMLPGDLRDKQVVELGAGTGRFTLPMVDLGMHVTATDINESMIASLRQKVEAAGATDRCRVQIGDIFNLSFPDASFDFAVTLHVIPRFLTLEDQRAALTEVARIIKPGGRLLFNYRNSQSFYARMHKGHTTSPRDIETILADAGLHVTQKRGKWLINRKALNALPRFMGRPLAAADRALRHFCPDRAWDVFVLAEKSA